MSRRATAATRPSSSTSSRVSMLSRHFASEGAAASPQSHAASIDDTVLFESDGGSRTFVLNRPSKLNALDAGMIQLLKPQLEEWERAEGCTNVVGVGKGRAFCAGGDVAAVAKASQSEETRGEAVSYFKQEFELDFQLATLGKPYVAIIDGITMGGGLGLSVHAPFRVATENTRVAMPETKIGYVPDVGSNFFLPRLDGEIGTYLALTGAELRGRAVFEHGLATHYIPARRIADLRARLAALSGRPENAEMMYEAIDAEIEELHFERAPDEAPSELHGARRVALDRAFGKKRVEDILDELENIAKEGGEVSGWAAETKAVLLDRSPTSLKVALEAVRRGKNMTLLQVLQMEMGLATAFSSAATGDFVTGVTSVLQLKEKGRPSWQPNTLSEVAYDDIQDRFFHPKSEFRRAGMDLQVRHQDRDRTHMFDYGLPSEDEIKRLVRGDHKDSGDKGVSEQQVVERMIALRRGKAGVAEKVREVVGRRCKVAETDYGTLKWM